MKNTNEITINLENASPTHVRLAAAILSAQSGFPIDGQLWAYLFTNHARLADWMVKDGDDANLEWMEEYLEQGWDEITLDNIGYLTMARHLENAADGAKNDPNNLYKAGAFYALAEAAADFLAEEIGTDNKTAYAEICHHYGLDL